MRSRWDGGTVTVITIPGLMNCHDRGDTRVRAHLGNLTLGSPRGHCEAYDRFCCSDAGDCALGGCGFDLVQPKRSEVRFDH